MVTIFGYLPVLGQHLNHRLFRTIRIPLSLIILFIRRPDSGATTNESLLFITLHIAWIWFSMRFELLTGQDPIIISLRFSPLIFFSGSL
jgi:hypothetical protein